MGMIMNMMMTNVKMRVHNVKKWQKNAPKPVESVMTMMKMMTMKMTITTMMTMMIMTMMMKWQRWCINFSITKNKITNPKSLFPSNQNFFIYFLTIDFLLYSSFVISGWKGYILQNFN